MTRGSLAIVGLVLLIVASGAAAHEIRPAYLQISEYAMAPDLMCCGKYLSAVKWF